MTLGTMELGCCAQWGRSKNQQQQPGYRGGVRPFNYEGGSYHSLLILEEAIRCFLNDLWSELFREDEIIRN